MNLPLSPDSPDRRVSTVTAAMELSEFSATEIARLTAFRQRCALIEFFDANEVQQLAFLKWRYDNGWIGSAADKEEGQVAMT